MNNWLKIGLPNLVAVLLVVAAVGVTLASTGGGNLKQVEATYGNGNTANLQYTYGPPGYVRCAAWRSAGFNGSGGWCWGRYN